MDLFENEQQIYENALQHLCDVRDGADCDVSVFASTTKAYGKMLKQLRRLTKAADETTNNLHNKALDLFDKDHAKSRFLARMSHEIRTPISAVLGISEIQLQDPALPPKTEDAFTRIYSSANTLLGIVNDILDLSKIEAGKMSIIIDEYDVANMINDVVQVNLVHLNNKKIDFVVQINENTPARLLGDELRIKQVLSNLLSNAFKYTSEGRVELTLHPEDCQQAGFINLSIVIKDTGHGMSPDQLETLNQEYSRFHEKEHRSTSGTGLGMHITFSLVQLMGATLGIASEVSKGTTMALKIPQEVVGEDVLGVETTHNIAKFESGALLKKQKSVPEPMPYGKVLVVDDLTTNLYVAKGLLSLFQLQIEICDSGRAAVDKVLDGSVYDIIFMDHMMPGLDGVETTKILHNIGYSQPIVALTANALIGQSDEFMANGFDGFLSKPIQTKELSAILNRFVRDKQVLEGIEVSRSITADTQDVIEEDQVSDDVYVSQEMAAMIRAEFLESQSNAFDEISSAIADNDMKTAHRLAHNLKSFAALMSEHLLESTAQNIESSLKDGEIPPSGYMDTLSNELKQITERLKFN